MHGFQFPDAFAPAQRNKTQNRMLSQIPVNKTRCSELQILGEKSNANMSDADTMFL